LATLAVLAGVGLRFCATAAPACGGAAIRFTPDYEYAIGSASFTAGAGEAEANSAFRWLANGAPLAGGLTAEGLLLNFDSAANGVNGESPTLAQGLGYRGGRWGLALALAANGRLQFERTNNLRLDQGTLELWVALRADGSTSAYASRSHVLFHYGAANGDYLQVAQSGSSGIIYVGGAVSNQWQSAYGSRGDMRAWRSNEWHHLAFTYSAAQNFMRFYVDGIQAAANNEGHYWPPAGTGAVFALGGDLSGNAAAYWVDAVRLSGRVADAAEILARARRTDGPGPNEVWLPTADVPTGSQLVFEFTPATATQTGTVCQSASTPFSGVPITNAQPVSTLLPPDTTWVDLSVATATNTVCAWSLGQALPFDQMKQFASGAGSRQHATRVTGLSPAPNTVNDVYVRCAAFPDFALRLQYRSLSKVNPPYPRTGNLWGWWEWRSNGLPYMSKVDLWLGASPPAEEIRELRRLNPHLRLLTSINAVENEGLPPDYYLKDIHGNRIEVWPGSYRLNLTKNYVAEYQARFAYQTVLDTGLMADGVFFDNVMTTQSWQQQDIYGEPVQIDANEDGQPDDPAVFDAAWKAGVFHEIRTFRQLMPHAIVSGHSMDIYEAEIGELFNGLSIGFATANVLEGEESFSSVWQRYHDWFARAVSPVTMMVESSPMDQIAYGYDYSPWQKIPPTTLEFARTYYPYVRFGLAFTLMNDGYFAHEYGDTWHGNHWWYDELDFDLGYPLGATQRVALPGGSGTNLVVNGGFDSAIADPWRLWAAAGCAATVSRDTTGPSPCARVVITATTSNDWQIDFAQFNRSLTQGAAYDLSFRARSSAPRPLSLSCQKGSPDWRNYGLTRQVQLTNQWQSYTVTFEANETANDARIQFFLGAATGTVWIDDVQLTPHPPDVYRRDFTRGVVLLNATREPRDVTLGAGFHRLTGAQAPMHEFILDDQGSQFSVTGSWTNSPQDSGEWKASGPFYHSWAGGLHERLDGSGEARWLLPIEDEDTYQISAWWPAAPGASNWTGNASYEIVASGVVVATTNLDQRVAGDQWHTIASVRLAPTNNAYVRLTAAGGAVAADALLIRSVSRFNNGEAADSVRLQPMDGIVLRRDNPVVMTPRFQRVGVDAGQVLLSLTNLTPGLTNELLRTTDLHSGSWQSRTAFQAQGFTTDLSDGPVTNQGAAFFRLHVK
jgi:hypothetical protein